jgi:ubiquinone/menaquinone biosynthesis C-methylase UbiE
MVRPAASAPARIAASALLLAFAACATREPVTPPPAASGPAHAHENAHGDGRATTHRRFDDVEKWARVFDEPTRAEWQKPAELVAALAIRPGMTVADVGAGTGFFLHYLSEAVGTSGKVLALEVETNLVSHMKNRVKDEGMPNVSVVLTPLDRLVIRDGAADVLLIVDAYHHIDHRVDYFRAAAGKLATGGRVAIVDWKLGDLPQGPDEGHKIAPEVVEHEMMQAGYRLLDSPDVLPYQYVLVFSRSDGTIPSR